MRQLLSVSSVNFRYRDGNSQKLDHFRATDEKIEKIQNFVCQMIFTKTILQKFHKWKNFILKLNSYKIYNIHRKLMISWLKSLLNSNSTIALAKERKTLMEIQSVLTCLQIIL